MSEQQDDLRKMVSDAIATVVVGKNKIVRAEAEKNAIIARAKQRFQNLVSGEQVLVDKATTELKELLNESLHLILDGKSAAFEFGSLQSRRAPETKTLNDEKVLAFARKHRVVKRLFRRTVTVSWSLKQHEFDRLVAERTDLKSEIKSCYDVKPGSVSVWIKPKIGPDPHSPKLTINAISLGTFPSSRPDQSSAAS